MRQARVAILAAGCLFAVSAAVAAGASARNFAWRGRPGMMHAGYMDFLDGVRLTPTQRGRMRQIVQQAWVADKADVAQLRSLRGQIADSLAGAGAVTQASLEPLEQQAAELREKLDADRLAAALQVRSLLTPDQLGTAANVHAQLKALRDQERALLAPGLTEGMSSPE